MLEKETLNELRNKMPRGFLQKIMTKYQELYGTDISRKTVGRFFTGESHSDELHNVVLIIIEEKNALLARTQNVING